MHATALEHLSGHLLPGARALDVGSGTGFLSACMARMVGIAGRVIGVDHIQQLVEKSLENVKSDESSLLRDLRVLDAKGGSLHEFCVTKDEDSESLAACGDNVDEFVASQPTLRGPLSLVVGDGRLGYPAAAPFDAIHVGAAAPEVPEALISQLAPGGRMIIPVGPEASRSAVETEQFLLCVDKRVDGMVETKKLMAVIYVPLTDKEHQLNNR